MKRCWRPNVRRRCRADIKAWKTEHTASASSKTSLETPEIRCVCVYSCVVLISTPFPDGIIVVAICAVSHNIH
jgi:hypothetical protein